MTAYCVLEWASKALHLYITDVDSSQPSFPPVLDLHRLIASGHIPAQSLSDRYFHVSFSRAVVYIRLPTLCIFLCLPINHHSLCFALDQSQDPVNQKTWLMELSLLLTTWAPLSCCQRETPPRTYAWCRPRRLSAGSRYSKTYTLLRTHTHTLQFLTWTIHIQSSIQEVVQKVLGNN